MKHLKFILPLFLILFSCSPDADDSVENTRLELTVLDESSAVIENVEVKLYASQIFIHFTDAQFFTHNCDSY